MNAESHDQNDAKLKDLLQSWKVDAPLPSGFQEQVWNRIARDEVQPLNPVRVLKLWSRQLALKPAFALTYAGVLIAVGIVGGLLQAQAQSDRASNELSVRYVQMLDPYQMPRH